MYRTILTFNGFDVIGTCNDGNTATQQYNNFTIKPDIVIVDYRLPIKNGLEVTIGLLKINHSAKILFFSADESIKEKALSTGAKAFLKKPADERSLLDIINKVINLKN